MLSMTPRVDTDVLAVSDNMFVHNNSKHGRRVKRVPSSSSINSTNNALPVIKHIFPSEVCCQSGGSAILIGENFHEGMQVFFGNSLTWSELITPQAIKVNIPVRPNAGSVDVFLCSPKGQPKMRSNSIRFSFSSSSEPSIDTAFQRLQKLLPKYPTDPEPLPKEFILHRAADFAEMLYVNCTAFYPIEPERLAATADYRNYPSQRVLNLASNPAAYIPYTNGNVAANFSNILYSSANGFCIIEPFIN
uniref:Uncharacterized protein n=1 Tax=Meloidogyne enterolobii TaxID=390850 RepID=A0A6V7XHH6_MELEN|nr:unnamed protein product [Meloidogyne enterolobii]